VVLIFYPTTFTGICQGELAAVQADLATLQNEAVQVIAVSVDSPFANKVWAEQQGFTFPILSDFWPHGAVAQAYGVFDDIVGRATRGTFVIDRDGIVRWKVVNAIPDAREHAQYARALAQLQG
jgi:peroxiredoxin